MRKKILPIYFLCFINLYYFHITSGLVKADNNVISLDEDLFQVNDVPVRVRKFVAYNTEDGSGLPEDTTVATTTFTNTTSIFTSTTTNRPKQKLLTSEYDVSIKNDLLKLAPETPVSIKFDSSPISLFTNEYKSIQVHRNGYVTFGSVGSVFARYFPLISLSAIKFPLFAPLWTDAILDKTDSKSNVAYSIFNKLNLPDDYKTFVSNAVQNSFSPDVILTITWTNLKPFAGSNKTISFQILFANNYATSKTYAIFNYDETTSWNEQDRSVLIGYTDGITENIIDFTNTINTDVNPYDIVQSRGNTDEIGVYVFDASFVDTDECNVWYNSIRQTPVQNDILSNISDKKFIPCPSTQSQIDLHPFYQQEQSIWQTDSFCYTFRMPIQNMYSQVCCYDKALGTLVRTGKNAGYFVNGDLDSIKSAGSKCCSNRDWSSCSRFYDVYQANTDQNYLAPIPAWTGGDPHFITFDNLIYTFNGYGKFVLARSIDNSFEIQGKTAVYRNANNAALSGTLFTAIALRTVLSQAFEFAISDNNAVNADIELYVDGVLQTDFTPSSTYSKLFPTTNSEISVLKRANGVLVLLKTGISVEIAMQSAMVTTAQKLSWLSCSLNTVANIRDYSRELEGLLGNLNGNSSDDISSRNGQFPTDLLKEQSIYPIANSWRVQPEDLLFSSRKRRDVITDDESTYVPTFDVPIDESIRATCGNEQLCMTDAQITGLVDVGLSTGNISKLVQTNRDSALNNAPIIEFKQQSINIDTSALGPVSIMADVYDNDKGDTVAVSFFISGAANYTIKNALNNTVLASKSIEIVYYPIKGEYPVFTIFADDNIGGATAKTVNIQICNCKNTDKDSECLFGNVNEAASPFVSIVQCKCSKYYTGDSCDQLINYCEISKPCESFTTEVTLSYTCIPYSVEQQKATNLTYYCDGNCPDDIYYTKNANGFCIDINECLDNTTCQTECTNTIGSYICKCPAGYTYSNNACIRSTTARQTTVSASPITSTTIAVTTKGEDTTVFASTESATTVSASTEAVTSSSTKVEETTESASTASTSRAETTVLASTEAVTTELATTESVTLSTSQEQTSVPTITENATTEQSSVTLVSSTTSRAAEPTSQSTVPNETTEQQTTIQSTPTDSTVSRQSSSQSSSSTIEQATTTATLATTTTISVSSQQTTVPVTIQSSTTEQPTIVSPVTTQQSTVSAQTSQQSTTSTTTVQQSTVTVPVTNSTQQTTSSTLQTTTTPNTSSTTSAPITTDTVTTQKSTSISTTSSTTSSTSSSTTTTTQILTNTTVQSTSTTTVTTRLTTLPTITRPPVTTTSAVSTTPFVPLESQLYNSTNDISIKNQILALSADSGLSISLENTPLNLINDQYTSIQVRRNGYVTFGARGEIFSRYLPYTNLNRVNNLLLFATFWTDAVLSATNSRSDISLTVASSASIPMSLKTAILNDLNAFVTQSGSQSTFTPDVLVMTVFVTNYASGKSFAIYNYEHSAAWTQRDKSVLMGYTDGQNPFQLRFSNTENPNINPYAVFSSAGNINKNGRYIFDVSYIDTDQCRIWYNTIRPTAVRSSLRTAINNDKYLPCPTSELQIKIHPRFRLVSSDWQTDSNCYATIAPIPSDYVQTICCYDKSLAALVGNGKNAGFMYTGDLSLIRQAGIACCGGNNWSNCRRFYDIYPQSTDDGYLAPIAAWTGGDPHVITFDEFSYTFNGFGQYVFSKAIDNSFEIQGQTAVFRNIDDPTISGTLITGLAFKTLNSPAVEIRLSDTTSLTPSLWLYVNGILQTSFTSNTAYFQLFPSVSPTVSVLQDTNGILITLVNGVSASIKMQTVNVTATQSSSWLTCVVNTVQNIRDYKSSLLGLMGNLNKNPNDDVVSRSGVVPSDLKSERSIYAVADTWRVYQNETLFLNNPIARADATVYTPTFDIVVSDEVKRICNNDRKCEADAALSGLKQMGLNTGKASSDAVAETKIALNRVPVIELNKLNFDVDLKDPKLVSITAKIYDNDDSDIVKGIVYVTGAANATLKTPVNNTVSKVINIQIDYYPKASDAPNFTFIAIDDIGAAVTTFPHFTLCNCKNYDLDAECLFNETLYLLNPYVSYSKCKCSKYFTGNNCEQFIDECAISKPCDSFSSEYTVKYTCVTYTVQQQKLLNKSYYCNGTCPNAIGYTKDENGFCFDINECENASACPNDALCLNTIGGFECQCDEGYDYKNNACQDVDECALDLDDCESICVNALGGYYCACDVGYKLVDSTDCVIDTTTQLTGCSAFNCSQICTADASNSPVCKCRKGYALGIDGKSCNDEDECQLGTSGCSDGCANTNGSFTCTCPIGKILDINKRTCVSCPDNTYGIDCSNKCDCANAIACDPVNGCICRTGYTGFNCNIDVNECILQNFTYYYSVCENTPGSFVYRCFPGFARRTADDFNCYDVNECVTPGRCPSGSTCNNTIGSFQCVCPAGYTFDQAQNGCVDTNECLNVSACPQNSKCRNLQGSYVCECDTGFKNSNSNTQQPNCTDINECTSATPVCASTQNCTNTIGSFACTCKTGYTLVASNNTCININECAATPNICKENATCVDQPGDYSCVCKVNYVDNNGVCLFKERSTTELQFQLLYKSLLCSAVTNDFYTDLTNSVVNLYASSNYTVSARATFISCTKATNSYPLIKLLLQFQNSSLNPITETSAVLLMTKLSPNVDATLLIDNNAVPLDNSDPCIIFNAYKLCANQGQCVSSNNVPSCACPSYPTVAYTGQYCEATVQLTTIATTKVTTLSTTTTTTKKSSDDTVLIVAIVLPTVAFLTILILSVVTFYFCYRKSSFSKYVAHRNNNPITGKISIPRIMRWFSPSSRQETFEPTNFEKSDFDFDQSVQNPNYGGDDDDEDNRENIADLIDFGEAGETDDNATGFEARPAQDAYNTYRTGYRFESSSIKDTESDFFKHLETNASLKQRSTIARPYSIYSDSMFSLPTAYHETTTPYGDFNNTKDFNFDNDDLFEEQHDDDLDDIVEAINPNVQIPRPRVQKYPMNYFKVGN